MPTQIEFTEKHMSCFRDASLDLNPLHLSAHYARQTPFGERVLYGMLGVLTCLREVRLPENVRISGLKVEFRSPILLGVTYSVVMRAQSEQEALVVIQDGSVLITRVEIVLEEGAAGLASLSAAPHANLTGARSLDVSSLAAGTIYRGSYGPPNLAYLDLVRLLGLDRPRLGDSLLIALLFASYAVGMELPGENAAFASLQLQVRHPNASLTSPFEIVFQEYDARFQMVSGAFQLGEGIPYATANFTALARPSRHAIVPPSPDSLPIQFNGRTALIIGASRGLGAAMALQLAAAGCTVIATFSQSAEDALRLVELAAHYPGQIVLEQGDATGLDWCRALKLRVSAAYGTLDLLICNAAPSIQPMRLEEAFGERIANYLQRGFALVMVPLITFAGLLNTSGGSVLLLSSSAVETPPKTWPHYVAAKCAAEGLVCTAAAAYPKTTFWIARPGRLLTDLTNTASNDGEAEAPEKAAGRLLSRIGLPGTGKGVQYIR